MKLRQAKKIFNRVCETECDLTYDSKRVVDESEEGSVYLDAVGICGYCIRQVDAAYARLSRYADRHPHMRPEWRAN